MSPLFTHTPLDSHLESQQSGIITLSQGLFNSAVATAIDEDEEQGSFTSLE
jgi:hypothetical protein